MSFLTINFPNYHWWAAGTRVYRGPVSRNLALTNGRGRPKISWDTNSECMAAMPGAVVAFMADWERHVLNRRDYRAV